MTRIMFPFFPLVAVAAAFMGILNACGLFFLPAFASALFNVSSVVVGVVLALLAGRYGGRWGISAIEGMAVGVVFGGAVQAFCQLPALYRVGYRWQTKLSSDPPWHRDPGLRRMLWLMIPGTIGLAATQVNILVNTVLATSQGPGAVSWLSYAFRLMQFPIGIFGVSLASATLPRISQLWVKNDVRGVQQALSQSLRHVMAINLPASAGLAFLGYPIVELIFEHGRFQPSDTRATALALAVYSIGLAAYSGVKVLVPACYALGKTRLSVVSSMISIAATIVLNLIWIKPFGYWGLALGTSVSAMVNLGFLLVSLRRLIVRSGTPFPLAPLFRSLVENLGCSLAMGVICFYSEQALRHGIPDLALTGLLGAHVGRLGITLIRLFRVSLLIAEGILVLVILARIFRLQDTGAMVRFFSERLKKKLSRHSS